MLRGSYARRLIQCYARLPDRKSAPVETIRLPRVVRFGVFEADRRSRELRKHGLRIKLHEHPFRVLELLLERPGRLITREEFQRHIWPADTLVDLSRG